jgi:hypothetical protein
MLTLDGILYREREPIEIFNYDRNKIGCLNLMPPSFCIITQPLKAGATLRELSHKLIEDNLFGCGAIKNGIHKLFMRSRASIDTVYCV